MTNKVKKVILFANGNTGTVCGIFLALGVVLWAWGCTPHVQSIVNPGTTIDIDELDAEVQNFLNTANLRYLQIDREQQLRNTIFEHAIAWTTTGQVNPLGVVTSVAALLGIGATVDNVRKRQIVKKYKLEKSAEIGDTS